MTEAADREELFVAFYERHYGEVLSYLRRRAPESVARDAAAEAFLAAWRHLDTALDRGLPWLYRASALTLRNLERAERRQQRTSDRLAALPAPDAAADSSTAYADRAIVLAALRQLPEVDRELLLLVAWEDLDIRSAAVAIGRSPGATAVRLHRARSKLRRILSFQDQKDSSFLSEVARENPSRHQSTAARRQTAGESGPERIAGPPGS